MFLQTINKIFSNDMKTSAESDALGNNFTIYEDFTSSTVSTFGNDLLLALLNYIWYDDCGEAILHSLEPFSS